MIINLGLPQPKQMEMVNAREKYVAYGGARGGGKSWCVRWMAIGFCLKYAGIKVLIVRETYPELENNHIVEKNGKYTDNCKVTFHNFDGDEFVSTFRVFRKKKYNEYKVGKLIKWLKNGKIENNQIIHTFYNYSVIFFTGCFYSDGKWKSFELMLSYSGDMVVEYELDKE